jgi:hypothetical protein
MQVSSPKNGLIGCTTPDSPSPHPALDALVSQEAKQRRSDLLRSNLFPEEYEIQPSRRLALSAERELAMLKQNLSIGTGHIHPKEDIVEFRHCLDDHKGVFSYLRRFPIEMLQEIMVLTAEFPGEDYMMDKKAQLGTGWAWAGPRCLSQVNRAWRSAALGLPVLWSYLFIPRIKRVPVKQLEIYLDRSGSALLTVSLTMRGFDFGSNLNSKSKKQLQQEKQLNLLLSTCQRWKQFILNMNGGMPFLEPIRGQLPNLRYLSIQAGDCSLSRSPFRNAPSLKYISFGPTTNWLKNLDDGLPFSTVQELKLVDCHVDVTSALRQCGQLRGLILRRTVLISQTVTLPSLQTLHIRDSPRYGMERDLPRLIAPSLQTLTINISGIVQLSRCRATTGVPTFTSMVQKLVIYTDNLDSVNDRSKLIPEVLEHFTAVEMLTMVETYKQSTSQKSRYFLDFVQYSSLSLLKEVVLELIFPASESNERRTVNDAPAFLGSLGIGGYVGELMYNPQARMTARHRLEKVVFRSNRLFRFTEQCRKEMQLLLQNAFVLDLDGKVMDEWEVKRRLAV